jgi:hypothetical protein
MTRLVSAGDTFRFFFTTSVGGVPATLSGTPAISVYKNVSDTQSTAGVTLEVDADGVAGFNRVTVNTGADGAFYAADADFAAVVTAGTVGGQSVAGTVAEQFTTRPPDVNTTLIEGSDATNQIRDAVVDDATRLDASALNTLSGHDPGETIMGTTDLGTGAGLTSLATAAALTTVDTIVDAIKAKTDNLPSDPADQSLIIAASDALAALIGTPSVDLVTDIAAAFAALNDLSAAEVNAEMVDALNVDTYAQPGQATPAATTTLTLMIRYLYKAWRNKHTQTATEYGLYNDDASTVDQKAAVSDDGTTFTRGEVASGP